MRTHEPVAVVAESGTYVVVGIKFTVDCAKDKLQVRMAATDMGDAFRRSDNAGGHDQAGAPSLQKVDGLGE